jgi:hypothetical protein
MSYPQPSVEGDIQHLLTEELGEQGVSILRETDTVVLRGEVLSEQRCAEIEQAVVQAFPDLRVRSELTVLPTVSPDGVEDLA